MASSSQQAAGQGQASRCSPGHTMRQLEAAVQRGLGLGHQCCLRRQQQVVHVVHAVQLQRFTNSSKAPPPQQHGHTQQQLQQQQQQHPQQQTQTLEQLLQTHLCSNPPSQQQQQQQPIPPSPASTARLERKLTSVLRDSTTSAADIADALLVADSSCCLNAIHVAAALARLVRLSDAQQAAAAAAADMDNFDGSDFQVDDGFAVTAVVPLSHQQIRQMRTVSRAAAGVLSDLQPAANNDGSSSSRWHTTLPSADEAGAGWQRRAAGDEFADDSQADEEFQQQQHLLEQLSLAAVELWPSMSASTITSICWSLAHLQHEPPPQLLQLAGAALADMAHSLHTQQQQQLSASPRQVIIMLWALAKVASDIDDVVPQQQQQLAPGQQSLVLGGMDASSSSSSLLLQHVLLCLAPHMPDCSSQGLLLLMWAVATWTKNSSSSTAGAPAVPAVAAEGLLSATAGAMESQALTSRGLAVVMWSAAHLALTPEPAWLGGWFAAMHEALPAAGPQDIAVAAWGLAHMGCPPPADWLLALSRRAAAVAPHMSARELPALLWAFARLRYRPPTPAVHALLQQGGRLASQGALSPQGLGLLLWFCGVLGVELPARWTDGVLAAAAGFLPLFRPLEASMLWTSLVKLQHIPPGAWLEVWWAGSKGLLAQAGGQQLVLLLWSSVKLGQGPPGHWMRAWLAAAQASMSRGDVTAQGYGLMWDALAQTVPTGLTPSIEWLSCYFAASQQPAVLAHLDPLTVDRTLSGLAAVGGQLQQGLELPQEWTRSMLAASLRLLPTANLVSLASMLQSAGQLALPLPPVWLAAAMMRLQQLLGQAGVLLPAPHSTTSSSSGSTDSVASSDSIGSSTHAPGRRFVRSARASSSSSTGAGRSMVLSARLERSFLQLCLQRVLFGLRAQQMLNPAPQRKLWLAAQQAAHGQRAAGAAGASADVPAMGPDAGASRSGVAGSSDALTVWPWLAPAVTAVWPSTQAAHLALQTLARGG